VLEKTIVVGISLNIKLIILYNFLEKIEKSA